MPSPALTQAPLPLKDIHLPAEIGNWPPAIGWWFLLLLIVLLIGLSWWAYKYITRNTPLKEAKLLLNQIKHDHKDDLHTLQQLSCWLRRVTISISPRQDSAGLTGTAWLSYLDASVDGSSFSDGAGRYLADAHFRQSVPNDIDITALLTLCETWLAGQSQ